MARGFLKKFGVLQESLAWMMLDSNCSTIYSELFNNLYPFIQINEEAQ